MAVCNASVVTEYDICTSNVEVLHIRKCVQSTDLPLSDEILYNTHDWLDPAALAFAFGQFSVDIFVIDTIKIIYK